jgi:hypothetical protein
MNQSGDCTNRTTGTWTTALAAALLSACASTPPIERYTPPLESAPTALMELDLMHASRNRSAALYVRGAPGCQTMRLFALLEPTWEAPPRLVAGSWERTPERSAKVVARLPAGEPLALRFRYTGPGEDYIFDMVLVLEPGARYLLDHEIPGRRMSIVNTATGAPPVRLPANWFHAALNCSR